MRPGKVPDVMMLRTSCFYATWQEKRLLGDSWETVTIKCDDRILTKVDAKIIFGRMVAKQAFRSTKCKWRNNHMAAQGREIKMSRLPCIFIALSFQKTTCRAVPCSFLKCNHVYILLSTKYFFIEIF